MLAFNSFKTYFKTPSFRIQVKKSNRIGVAIASALALILQESNEQNEKVTKKEWSAVSEWQWHRLHMLNGMLAFFTCNSKCFGTISVCFTEFRFCWLNFFLPLSLARSLSRSPSDCYSLLKFMWYKRFGLRIVVALSWFPSMQYLCT